MCKGLTSPGAKMEETSENKPVAIHVEGKQNAMALGITKLSTKKMYLFYFF
jgi:malignant T-cell-amplified sequence